MKLSRTRNLLACLLVALAAGCAILTEPGPEAQNAAQRINSEIKEYRNGAPPPAVRSDATGYVRGGNLFAQVYEQVQLHYVRAVDEETLVAAASKEMRKRYPDPSKVKDKDLVEAAVYGMLGSLDSYSTYLDEEHWRSLREQTRGRFGGLGIEVRKEGEYIEIVSPIVTWTVPLACLAIQPASNRTFLPPISASTCCAFPTATSLMRRT